MSRQYPLTRSRRHESLVPARAGVRGLSLAALLTGALAAASCSEGVDAALPDEEVNAPAPVNVAVTRIQAADLTERIELSGRLEPWVEVRVASELGGLVELVGFEKGAHVAESRVLARIGTDMHQAALDEAEAVLAGAEAAYERALALVGRQAVPRQNAINATAEYEAARARVAQNRLRLNRSIVRAPVTGLATTRDVEPGEVLAPGTVVTTIHRIDRLKAVVGIPESDAVLFRIGGPATIRVDAWRGRTFDGVVHFVASSAAGSTRTFQAEVAVDNRDGALRPGMIARVSLPRRSFAGAIVVPRDALQERDLGAVAVVVEHGLARVRPVTLGAVEGDRVLVESGLEAGETLITSGHRGLIDGQRVQIVEQEE